MNGSHCAQSVGGEISVPGCSGLRCARYLDLRRSEYLDIIVERGLELTGTPNLFKRVCASNGSVNRKSRVQGGVSGIQTDARK